MKRTDASRRDFCVGCAAALSSGCAPVDNVFFTTDSDSGPGGEAPTPDTPDPREVACAEPLPTGPERLSLPFADYPELAATGGFVGIASSAGELIVARVADDCVVAMRRACTHEGVPINFVAGRDQFVCPNHGAVYEWDGSKFSGPQPRGLPTYPAGIDGDAVVIDVS
ncbi:MAG: Rieske (2Fe-2S) protein [Myxococcota bacterium]